MTRTKSRAKGQYGKIYAQQIDNNQRTDAINCNQTLQSARTTLINKQFEQINQHQNQFSLNNGSLIKKSQLGRTLFGS